MIIERPLKQVAAELTFKANRENISWNYSNTIGVSLPLITIISEEIREKFDNY